MVRAPSPMQEPFPAPANDDNRDGRSGTLAAPAKSVPGNSGQGSLFAHALSDRNRSRADTALQAKHVRIDV